MVINGRDIAEAMYSQLKKRVGELQKNHVTPHLVVLFVGDDHASASYIRQKQIAGEKIGARVTVLNYAQSVATSELLAEIDQLNKDTTVHAIIIQKPLPRHIDIAQLDRAVLPQKDIDGFNPESEFILALPLATLTILHIISHIEKNFKKFIPEDFSLLQFLAHNAEIFDIHNVKFTKWLETKKIVIIGKGKTGGQPIHDYFKKLAIAHTIISSQTPERERKDKLSSGDILIVAVGKEHVIKAEDIKVGSIVIGVGLFRNKDGKLTGDYYENAIKNVASFYTPTPGGVGPVNVACLMENLVIASEQQNIVGFS